MSQANEYIVFLGDDIESKNTAVKTLTHDDSMKQSRLIKQSSSDNDVAAMHIFHYGKINFDNGQKVHLLRVESETQLKLLKPKWENNALGVLIFVSTDRESPEKYLEDLLLKHHDFLSTKSIAIGLVNPSPDIPIDTRKYNETVTMTGYNAAVFEIDVTNFQDMSILLQSMLMESLHGLASA
ncbi:hypothetical protein [Pleionea sediminis]|uniref:hypothetical protein n=1 Tax=Pleionea sediminis TaxID=2569479 RepID=UPI001185FA45|nr:hypothetical protein [Pleionea sediminis]